MTYTAFDLLNYHAFASWNKDELKGLKPSERIKEFEQWKTTEEATVSLASLN